MVASSPNSRIIEFGGHRIYFDTSETYHLSPVLVAPRTRQEGPMGKEVLGVGIDPAPAKPRRKRSAVFLENIFRTTGDTTSAAMNVRRAHRANIDPTSGSGRRRRQRKAVCFPERGHHHEAR
ncbi:hypothetical protein QYE76_037808 [Lolium multiflorum]|uniref:Uncharacterized protein n=1 Tax=Lolium multiflorum TaxID=4521 RepID=A0AAD8QF82_LOLMU|nr:hypothetical protein QYE76_037808 [Lolium multiflorum]